MSAMEAALEKTMKPEPLTSGRLNDIATYFQSIAKLRELVEHYNEASPKGNATMEISIRVSGRTKTAEIFDGGALMKLIDGEAEFTRGELASNGVRFGDWA